MGFIQKNDAIIINTKLTNIGRLLLASGSLTFKKIEFGDSEIDYNFIRNNTEFTGSDLLILRPKDLNPTIKSPIPISQINTTTKKDILSINPIEIEVINTAKERGFYTGSTNSGFTSITNSDYIIGTTYCLVSGMTGGTVLNVETVSSITTGNTLLIDWRNPTMSGLSFNDGVIYEDRPRQFIWYKVLSIVGNNITVDKPLPNFSSIPLSNKNLIYIFPKNNAVDNYYSTGTTVSYWNDNTLAFNSNCNISNDDVTVWNFNIVYTNAPAGVTNGYLPVYYDSSVFSGFKEYILGSSTNSGLTQLGIIHYTNNSISNYYGEGFSLKTFSIDIPTIMYHAKTATTMGIKLISYGDKKSNPTNLSGFTTEYYDLVESTSLNVVGKVFNDLKIAIIEDQEILTTLSIKSNRSHTLPTANWQSVNATQTELTANNTLLKNSNSYLALTYIFESSNSYLSYSNLGYSTSLHCGDIKKIYYNTQQQNIIFNFNLSDLKFLQDQSDLTTGFGYNANGISILAQIVPNGIEPLPNQWRKIDYTTRLTDYGTWGATTIPKYSLTDSLYRLNYDDYTGGTIYSLTAITSLPAPSNLTGLGFGEESILLGNINTNIKAVVYRTQILQKLNLNEYNTSNNTTFQNNNDTVFISEVGVYDDNNNLVAIGKLNDPIKKDSTKLVTIELDMDF